MNAQQARELTRQNLDYTDRVVLEFYTRVQRRIEKAAREHLRKIRYTMPITQFGKPYYDAPTVLRKLLKLFAADGYKVRRPREAASDFELIISW